LNTQKRKRRGEERGGEVRGGEKKEKKKRKERHGSKEALAYPSIRTSVQTPVLPTYTTKKEIKTSVPTLDIKALKNTLKKYYKIISSNWPSLLSLCSQTKQLENYLNTLNI
jgi:hypothetical protein